VYGSKIKKNFQLYFYDFFHVFQEFFLYIALLAKLYTSTFCIVGNQLDSGIMVRLAIGGLLNGISIIGDKFMSESHTLYAVGVAGKRWRW